MGTVQSVSEEETQEHGFSEQTDNRQNKKMGANWEAVLQDYTRETVGR